MNQVDKNRLLRNKEGVLKAISNIKVKIMDIAKNDTIHTVAFYNEFLEVIDNFNDAINKVELPVLAGNWTYLIVAREDGLELYMRELLEAAEGKDKYLSYAYNVNSNLSLIKVRCKMYTLADYAKENNIAESAVVQKIRRGGISSAVKVSNYWYIPALSKHAIDTPKVTSYTWGDDAIFIPEYEELKNFNEVSISKSQSEKNKYEIKLTYKKVKQVNDELTDEEMEILEKNGTYAKWAPDVIEKRILMNIAEKERFEGMLIANNFVTCASNKLLEIIY